MYLAVAVYFSEACSVFWYSVYVVDFWCRALQWISSAVQCSGFVVQCSGFPVQCSGFVVQCSAVDGSDRDGIGVTGRQREPSALLQNVTNTFQGIVQ